MASISVKTRLEEKEKAESRHVRCGLEEELKCIINDKNVRGLKEMLGVSNKIGYW